MPACRALGCPLCYLGGMHLLSILIGCPAAPDIPERQDVCDRTTYSNHGRPFGHAEVGDPPQSVAVIRLNELLFNSQPVLPGPDGFHLSQAGRDAFRLALAKNRAMLGDICRRGGSPFDHTLLFVVGRGVPFDSAYDMLEDARDEGYEDVHVVFAQE